MPITLVYHYPYNKTQTRAVQEGAFRAVVFDQGELLFLGLSVAPGGDTTTDTGTDFIRTLILDESPDFLLNFPSDTTKTAATANLFRGRFSAMLYANVTADVPVLS